MGLSVFYVLVLFLFIFYLFIFLVLIRNSELNIQIESFENNLTFQESPCVN